MTPLIQSIPTETIKGRFLTKVSEFNNGNDKPSIMIVVFDILEVGITIKFVDTYDEFASFIKLLKSV